MLSSLVLLTAFAFPAQSAGLLVQEPTPDDDSRVRAFLVPQDGGPVMDARGLPGAFSPSSQGRGGWLGVSINEGGDEQAPRLEVLSVTDGSAAAKAGLRAGDRILSFNSRPAGGYQDFAASVQSKGPGTRVRITIERDLEAELGQADDDENRPFLGVSLSGSSVSSVTRNSAAARASIQKDDRIIAIGNERCESSSDVIAVIRSRAPGDPVSLTVRRDVPVVLGARPGEGETEQPSSGFFFEDPRAEEDLWEEQPWQERHADETREHAHGVERQAQIERLHAEVAELTELLESLTRELEQLQRELARLR